VKSRIPPGQVLVKKWPRLDVNPPSASVSLKDWKIKIFGNVKNPIELNFEDLYGLGPVRLSSDLHCVTHWSLLDNAWEGVPLSRVLDHAGLKKDSKCIMCYGLMNYSTNVNIKDAILDSSLIVWSRNGEEISYENGGPVRFIIPHLYLWKSAKWATGIEVMTQEKLGFWETRGYHNRGDPWLEERFS